MLRNACNSTIGLWGRTRPLVAATVSQFDVPHRLHRPFRYPKVDYLPFDWDYPPKKNFIFESGDRSSDYGLTEEFLDRPTPPFGDLPEFETAPDCVKKVFSIRFTSDKEKRQALFKEFIKRVQRHPYDFDSFEFKIARCTFFIRAMRGRIYRKMPYNRRLKVACLEAYQTRLSLLSDLDRLDTERYEFVKEVLGIEHTTPPLERIPPRLFRKGVLEDLTTQYANKMKEDKMQNYHDKLKELQKEFETEKKQAEEWIAKEIADLNLTEEEIQSLEYKGKVLQ